MKIAPLVRACDGRAGRVTFKIVHTGQHYDAGMSDVFFQELGIPKPNYYLNAGGGGHSEQTATIMQRFDPICSDEKPDVVVVVGDVNSTLACSIVAKKMQLPVAHVEAGLRSGDRSMPEEINRLVTDSISDLFFVTEPSGQQHLLNEGHDPKKIHFVGHVMIDNLFYELNKLGKSDRTSVEEMKPYGVVTLHRPSNVDSRQCLERIITGLNGVAEKLPLIFPVHPRTRKNLTKFGLHLSKNIEVKSPLGYRDFLSLWKDAQLVLTDSGGLQEETTALGIPCLTIRDNTERPVTVDMGSNRIAGTESNAIIEAADECLKNPNPNFQTPPLWDGEASDRILDALEEFVRNRN